MSGEYNKISGLLIVPLGMPPNNFEVHLLRGIPPCVKAAFEDFLEVAPRRRLMRIRKKLGEELYAESVEKVAMLSAAGKMRWGGEVFRESIADAAGLIELTVLIAHEAGQKELTRAQVAQALGKNAADSQVLAAALKEVFDADPNFLDPPEEGTVPSE